MYISLLLCAPVEGGFRFASSCSMAGGVTCGVVLSCVSVVGGGSVWSLAMASDWVVSAGIARRFVYIHTHIYIIIIIETHRRYTYIYTCKAIHVRACTRRY